MPPFRRPLRDRRLVGSSDKPPVVTITSPAAGASVDWGSSTTLEATVEPGSSTITSVHFWLGATDLGAASNSSGTTWELENRWRFGHVGAGQTFACRVVAGGATYESTQTLTVVDPIAELGGSRWKHGDTPSLTTLGANALSAWSSTGLTGWTGSELVETNSTSEHSITGVGSLIQNAPATFTVRITPSTRTNYRLALGAATCFFACSGAGSVGTASGCSGYITRVGDSYDCMISVQAVGAAANPKLNVSTDGATISYAGNSSSAGTVVSATVAQLLADSVAPLTGALANFAQSDNAKKPVVWDGTRGVGTSGLRYYKAPYMDAAFALSQPFTVFNVLDIAAVAAANQFVHDGLGSGNRAALYREQTSGNWYLNCGTARNSAILASTDRSLIVARANGASSFVRQNGQQSGNLDCGTHSLTGLRLCAGYNGLTQFDGQLCDTVIVPGAISADNIQRIEKALATEWELAFFLT